jgi:hypothetical protein
MKGLKNSNSVQMAIITGTPGSPAHGESWVILKYIIPTKVVYHYSIDTVKGNVNTNNINN